MVAMLYSMPGELQVLIRPPDRIVEENQPEQALDPNLVLGLFKELDSQYAELLRQSQEAPVPGIVDSLHEDLLWNHENPYGLRDWQGKRMAVLLGATGRLLQTVRLTSWDRGLFSFAEGWKVDLRDEFMGEWLGDQAREVLKEPISQVYRVVGWVNERLARLFDARMRVQLDDFELLAASPNWLTGAQVCCCYCPADLPTEPKGDIKKFKEQKLKDLLDPILGSSRNDGKKRVRVAVFDTWPIDREDPDPNDNLKKIKAQKEKIDREGKNKTLEKLANGGIVKGKHIQNFVEPGMETTVHACHRKCDDTFYDPSDVSPHGVFVANIIKDLFPRADIWVYRVLDDWGIGNQERLARAVRQAILDMQVGEDEEHPNQDRPDALVLNLSLGIGPPPALIRDVLTDSWRTLNRETWAPHASGLIAASRPSDAEAIRKLREMQVANSLFALGDLQPGVLAIAAAGNDSCRDPRYPNEGGKAPRFPAISEDVIGVSAVNDDGVYCEFSNQDDHQDPPDDGIAACGKDIIGLFTSDLGWSDPDKAGWARWSGTSFSTPVVSAIAAAMFACGLSRDMVADNIIYSNPVIDLSRPYWDLRQEV